MTTEILLALLSILLFVVLPLFVVCLCVIAARADREMDEKFREHLRRHGGDGWRV